MKVDDISRWRGIVSRFSRKLIKMIKDFGSKFDDYSISPKTRKIFLHWGCEINKLINKVCKLMYKNKLLAFQPKRSITKSRRKIF